MLPADRAFLGFRVGAGVGANAKGAPNKDGNTRSGGTGDKSSAPTESDPAAEAAYVLFYISTTAQN